MPRRPRDLDEYRNKRDPGRTQEPFGPFPRSGRRGTRRGEFVVHLHRARRLHYDLRLEVGGVLLSFAVPKGPSLAPSAKRLAVQTEAHPLDYLHFEDVIPEGNYGAGAMIAWDHGQVRYLETTAEEGLERGKIDFVLDGYKLKGRFALVRTSNRKAARGRDTSPEWLLLKKDDVHAREDHPVTEDKPRSILSGLTVLELGKADEIGRVTIERATERGAVERDLHARHLRPMLCTTGDGELEDEGWYFELKLDGVRILAERDGPDATLYYRTGRVATRSYPEVTRALRHMVPSRFVLDGEIVAFDDAGRPSFERLLRRVQVKGPHDIRYAMRAVPAVYVVFDVLAVDGLDLRPLPLSARKDVLRHLVRGEGPVRTMDFSENDGRALYSFCEQHGLEGLIKKRARSTYRSDERSPDWVKIKRERDDELVVIGYTMGEGSRRRLGALDLASYEPDGRLVVRGKVGSGLGKASIDELLRRLRPLHRDTCPAEGELDPAPHGRQLVEPELVVGVRYGGWADSGRLRFPVYRGIRDDVRPEECTARPKAAGDAVLVRAESASAPASSRTSHGVALSNQDKLFWPEDGYTKGDLCAYYEAVSSTLLPYLMDRPVVLVRYPDGIHGKSFYQWNLPEGAPPWVRSVPLRFEGKRERHAFLVEDVATLLYLANLGAIPLHVVAARTHHLEQCDFVTFDFDVGESTPEAVVTLARELHAILQDIALPGFPKTSGQTGLHVLVPLGPGRSFDVARNLADLLGRLLVGRHPDLATMERRKEKRGPRVLVDTGQTGSTRTIVAPYSVRAHPGATVSTPLSWDEVGYALDPRSYDMETVPERLARYGDPMAPLLTVEPDIEEAVRRLGVLLER